VLQDRRPLFLTGAARLRRFRPPNKPARIAAQVPCLPAPLWARGSGDASWSPQRRDVGEQAAKTTASPRRHRKNAMGRAAVAGQLELRTSPFDRAPGPDRCRAGLRRPLGSPGRCPSPRQKPRLLGWAAASCCLARLPTTRPPKLRASGCVEKATAALKTGCRRAAEQRGRAVPPRGNFLRVPCFPSDALGTPC